MPYATQADLETRFGSAELAQLTDRISGSVIDAAVVGRALADAEAEIDGYLAARYQLPLASAPAVLGRITQGTMPPATYSKKLPKEKIELVQEWAVDKAQ